MNTEQLQQALAMRTEEVAQYQANIDMFYIIALGLPSELPEHLQQYRARTDRHQAAAEVIDMNDVQLLCDVWAYDDMQGRIRSEMVEMRKSMAIQTALQAQLDLLQ